MFWASESSGMGLKAFWLLERIKDILDVFFVFVCSFVAVVVLCCCFVVLFPLRSEHNKQRCSTASSLQPHQRVTGLFTICLRPGNYTECLPCFSHGHDFHTRQYTYSRNRTDTSKYTTLAANTRQTSKRRGTRLHSQCELFLANSHHDRSGPPQLSAQFPKSVGAAKYTDTLSSLATPHWDNREERGTKVLQVDKRDGPVSGPGTTHDDGLRGHDGEEQESVRSSRV